MILFEGLIVSFALVGSNGDDYGFLHLVKLDVPTLLYFLVKLKDFVARLNATHKRHVDIHQNELKVPIAADFVDICCVLVQALQTIHARNDLKLGQDTLELHLDRHNIHHLVIDQEAAPFATLACPHNLFTTA